MPLHHPWVYTGSRDGQDGDNIHTILRNRLKPKGKWAPVKLGQAEADAQKWVQATEEEDDGSSVEKRLNSLEV